MATTSTINPAVLNALTLQYGRDRANLDDQQNRRRINYNNTLDSMRRTYDDTELKNRESLADRGMLQSGPSLAAGVKLQDVYNRGQGTAAESYNLDLATIARKRLEADQEYNTNKILASLGLSIS